MRVAFLSQWWSPPDGGVVSGLAHGLADTGLAVDVITGHPGLNPKDPRTWWRRRDSSWRGIRVTRRNHYFSQDLSAARRMATYGSYAARASLAASELRPYDAVLVYGSPATTVAPALIARRRYGTPFVFMVQDLWPDSIFATGFLNSGFRQRTTRLVVDSLVESAYRNAAAVTALSPQMRDVLISRGVPAGKAHCVYNWHFGEDHAPPFAIGPRAPGEPLHLMYAGTMGLGQELSNVLRAISLLPEGSVRLTLIGDGTASGLLREEAGNISGARVEFHEWVSQSELLARQSTAHLHIISLADQPLFRATIPSKLQALSATGAPILCVAPGAAAEMVAKSGMGVSAPPGDPVALAEVLRGLLDCTTADLAAMGRNGQAYYRAHLSREINATRLAEVLSTAAQDRPARVRPIGTVVDLRRSRSDAAPQADAPDAGR